MTDRVFGSPGLHTPRQDTNLSIAGAVQGAVLYFDGAAWVTLPPGVAGQQLTTQGPGANPTWGAGGAALVTAAAQGEVNPLGAASTVMTTDGATPGGAWQLLADANIAAGAAIAGTKITPDFGAQDITTTGDISLGTTPATTGLIRIPHGESIQGRNNANTLDVNILAWGVAGIQTFELGSTSVLGMTFDQAAAQTYSFLLGGADLFVFNGTAAELTSPIFRFGRTVPSPTITQENESAALNGDRLLVRSQQQTLNAVGPHNSGDLDLRSGAITGILNTGVTGNLLLSTGAPAAGGASTAGDIMLAIGGVPDGGVAGAGIDIVEFAEANSTVQLALTGDMRIGNPFTCRGRS
jgi:hypothetical protein